MRAYVYRVAFTEPQPGWKPEGWDDKAAEDHPQFAVFESQGDGYNEPIHNSFAIDPKDDRPVFRIPTKARRRYLSKASAARWYVLLNEWPGLSATVERAPFGPWEEA